MTPAETVLFHAPGAGSRVALVMLEETGRPYIATKVELLTQQFEVAERALSDGGDWLMGTRW